MSTTSHLDDEQLTALQDGDGAADERAHLTSCTRCAERSRALTAAAALVAASPPPPSDEAREGAVAAALAGAERPGPPRARPGPRRRPRRQVPGWLLPAAAVVALLAMVAAIVPQLGRGTDDDGGDAATEAAGSAAESSGDARGGGGTDAEAPALQGTAVADLGAVDDEADLARRVEDALAGRSADDAGSEPAASDPCVANLRAEALTLEPLRLRASLVWRGQPAAVLSDGTRAVVVSAEGCTPLADVDLG